MPITRAIIGLFAAVIITSSLWGRDADKATPKSEESHEVDFPRGDAAWTVIFKTEGTDVSKASRAGTGSGPFKQWKRMEIVRQGNVRRDLIKWLDGKTTELWWVTTPPVVLFDDGDNGHVSGMKAMLMASKRYDETSLDWVNGETFKEVTSFNGHRCRYYKMTIVEEDSSGSVKKKFQAWIDVKTNRPVAFDNNGVLVTFVFKDDEAEPLVMPDRFVEKLKSYQAFLSPAG